jgi:hypothetical protein
MCKRGKLKTTAGRPGKRPSPPFPWFVSEEAKQGVAHSLFQSQIDAIDTNTSGSLSLRILAR